MNAKVGIMPARMARLPGRKASLRARTCKRGSCTAISNGLASLCYAEKEKDDHCVLVNMQ